MAVGRRAEFIGVAYSRLGTAAGAYAGGCGLLSLQAGRRRARLGSYFSRAQFGFVRRGLVFWLVFNTTSRGRPTDADADRTR